MERLSQITLPARLENLADFIRSVKDGAEKQAFTPRKLRETELAVEETLVNIFNYAYEGEPGYARLTCFLDEDSRFVIEIEDQGNPFNPLSLGEPDLTSDLMARQIGGLGVFFVRKFMSEVRYRREEDRNIIRMTV